MTSYTGLWVVTKEFGLVIVREGDDEHYQLVSKLHEVAHVLTSYGPRSLVESLAGSVASTHVNGSILRMCAVDDKEASPAAARLELFVEDVALELEHRIRVRVPTMEQHL